MRERSPVKKQEGIYYQFLKPTEVNPWVVPKRIKPLRDSSRKVVGFMLDDSMVKANHHFLPDEFFNHEIVHMCSDDPEQISELVFQYGILQIPLPMVSETSTILRKLGKLNHEESWQDEKPSDSNDELVVEPEYQGSMSLEGLEGIDRERAILANEYQHLDETIADTKPVDLLYDDADRLIEDLRIAHASTYSIASHLLDYFPERITGTIISLAEIRTVAREIVNATNLIKWIGMGLSHTDMIERLKTTPLIPVIGKPMKTSDPVRRAFLFLELCSTPAFLYRVVGDEKSEIHKFGEEPRMLPAGNREGSLLEAVSIQLQSAATNGLPWHTCVWCDTLFQFKRGSSKEKTERKRTEGNVYCCEKCRNSATQKAFRERKKVEREARDTNTEQQKGGAK